MESDLKICKFINLRWLSQTTLNYPILSHNGFDNMQSDKYTSHLINLNERPFVFLILEEDANNAEFITITDDRIKDIIEGLKSTSDKLILIDLLSEKCNILNSNPRVDLIRKSIYNLEIEITVSNISEVIDACKYLQNTPVLNNNIFDVHCPSEDFINIKNSLLKANDESVSIPTLTHFIKHTEDTNTYIKGYNIIKFISHSL